MQDCYIMLQNIPDILRQDVFSLLLPAFIGGCVKKNAKKNFLHKECWGNHQVDKNDN